MIKDAGYLGSAIWDRLYCHLVAIAALEERMQTRFGDINIRVNDLTTRLKALELRPNMNRGRRDASVGDDIRGQPIRELVRANPRGQYDYRYSSDDEDRGKVTGNNRYDQNYHMKVEIFLLVI
jgi:hypothetical protein